jgi:sigma-B regulation protein RsbU (phosphoserine phosphatase)
MAEVRTLLRAQANSALNASTILKTLNSQLYEDLTRAELFITMFYLKYDAARRLITYSSAGHNHPLLYRNGEFSCTELDAEGLILGVNKEVVYEEKSLQLREGDILLMYTDGVTEAQNAAGELFGEQRLCQILAENHDEQPDLLIDLILEKVSAFTDSQPLTDDVSIVLIRVA